MNAWIVQLMSPCGVTSVKLLFMHIRICVTSKDRLDNKPHALSTQRCRALMYTSVYGDMIQYSIPLPV